MRVTLTDDQRSLAAAFAEVLAKECPTTLVRDLQASGESKPERLWSVLSELGVFGLGLAEGLGGAGGDLFDVGLFFEAAGRVLCPTAVYSTIGCRLALQRLATDAQQERLLPGLASGELVGSLALWNPSDAGDLSPSLSARRVDDGWCVSGTLTFVPNADVADVLVATATTGGDGAARTIGLILAREQVAPVSRRLRTFSRDNQCIVELVNVQVSAADVMDPTEEGIDVAALGWVSNAVTSLQCMEMTGGALAVIERTVDYIKNRYQFDRPIASFQAAQHHIADMHIAIDGARLTAYQAVWLVGRGRLADREVAIAKLKANEAYKRATLTAHQLHGGMGFLRETDLHLWSERAKSSELLGGAWDVQLARLERALELSD